MKQQLKIGLTVASIIAAATALGGYVASTSTPAPSQQGVARMGDGKNGPQGMA